MRHPGQLSSCRLAATAAYHKRESERLTLLADPASEDVLSRTTVISEVPEARAVVQRLLANGQAVGVDMEGILKGEGQPTSLVQVADANRNIFLFRTGINTKLYKDGRLKELLEAPHITKVIHASTVDCLSVYKDGVKMWGLYDTAVAHRVLELQNSGSSAYSSPTIGLNALCTYCGLEQNPWKDAFKDTLWKLIVYKNVLMKKGPLPKEVILYCAWDVEPLLNIHESLGCLIDPDFAPFVGLLSEIELIRCIDKELARRKRTSWKNLELASLFLSDLPHTANKADLYQLVAAQGGQKQVFFSYLTNSALVVLDSPEDALNFRQTAAHAVREVLGPATNMKLVAETVKELENDPPEEGTSVVEGGGGEGGCITKPEPCRELVRCLLSAEVPVVVDFHHFKQDVSTVELYVGTASPISLLVTSDTIQEGELGLFFSSRKIPKVVFRTDTSSTYAVLKRLAAAGEPPPQNLFDLSVAFRLLDYIQHGQSVFKSQSPSMQIMWEGLRLPGSSSEMAAGRLERYYRCYLALRHLLPPVALDFLTAKTAIDLRVGSGTTNMNQEKQKRKELRTAWELNVVHIRLPRPVTADTRKQLTAALENYLAAQNIRRRRLDDLGSVLLLQLESGEEARRVETFLSTWRAGSESSRLTVTCPDTLKASADILEKDVRLPPDLLEKQVEANREALARTNFVEALARHIVK